MICSKTSFQKIKSVFAGETVSANGEKLCVICSRTLILCERMVGGKKAIKVMRKERQGAPLEEGLRDHITRHNKENEWKMVLDVSVLLPSLHWCSCNDIFLVQWFSKTLRCPLYFKMLKLS